ncbi:MAG: MBL fold metallo-hydrolase [Candidatus Humimicrobiaceae bacterium]
MQKKTKITFFGHSMFVVESKNGLRIGMDPFDENVKSRLPDIAADIVTVSHSHFDHSNTGLFKGSPEIVKGSVKFNKNDIYISGYNSFHDNNGGRLRGENIIFEIKTDGIRFVHLGDFGSFQDDNTINMIKNMDILFIPVGGVYTINFIEAAELIKTLNPKVAIPMHFKEKDTKMEIDEINSFRNILKNYIIKELGNNLEITKEELPSKVEVWIMHSNS